MIEIRECSSSIFLFSILEKWLNTCKHSSLLPAGICFDTYNIRCCWNEYKFPIAQHSFLLIIFFEVHTSIAAPKPIFDGGDDMIVYDGVW